MYGVWAADAAAKNSPTTPKITRNPMTLRYIDFRPNHFHHPVRSQFDGLTPVQRRLGRTPPHHVHSAPHPVAVLILPQLQAYLTRRQARKDYPLELRTDGLSGQHCPCGIQHLEPARRKSGCRGDLQFRP